MQYNINYLEHNLLLLNIKLATRDQYFNLRENGILNSRFMDKKSYKNFLENIKRKMSRTSEKGNKRKSDKKCTAAAVVVIVIALSSF